MTNNITSRMACDHHKGKYRVKRDGEKVRP